MNLGKDETKVKNSPSPSPSPAPLPMYQRVALKHVPTMVRRRYDSHLHNLTQDFPSKDGKTEADGVENVDPDFAASDVVDGANVEAEDDARSQDVTNGDCDTNEDTLTCTEDFALSSSMCMEDKKSEVDGREYVILANSLESIDENRIQDNGFAKGDNAQDGTEHANLAKFVDNSANNEVQNNENGSDVENNGSNGTMEADIVSYSVDDGVQNGMEAGNSHNKQGLLLEDGESLKKAATYGDASLNMVVQDGGPETEPDTVTENSPTMMTFEKNATKGHHSPCPLPMYQRVTLKHVPTMIRRRYDRDLHKIDAGEDCASEDGSESEGERGEYANPASTLSEVDDGTGGEGENVTETADALANFETKYGAQTHTEDMSDLPSKDSKSEGDEVEDVNPTFVANDVDDGAQSEDATTEKCNTNLDTQTCKVDIRRSAMDGVEQAVLANYVDNSAKNEVQNNEHGSDVENNRWDSNGTKDANIVSYCVDDSGENDMEIGNSNSKQENLKSEADGTKDVKVGYYTDDSDEDETKDKENGIFGNKQGLLFEDSESHKVVASYGDASVNMDVQDVRLETEPGNSLTMMTFEENTRKGCNFPRPLPMYQRVTLKHVPTMVRRRYDKDLHKFDAIEDWASEDSTESNVDRADYANPAFTLSEVDGSTDHKAEFVTETTDALANFETKHDAQTYTEYFDGNDSVKIGMAMGNSDNKQGNSLTKMTFEKNAVKGYHSPRPLPMYQSMTLQHVPTMVRRRYDKDLHKIDAGEGKYSEDGRSEDDVAEKPLVSSLVVDNGEDKMQVNGHAKFDSVEAEDVEDKNVSFTDFNARDDVQNNELDLESYHVADSAEDDDVQKKEHGSSDINHGLHSEYCKSEGDGTDAATYEYKDEVQDKEFGNFDNKYGLPTQDAKTQDNGAGDEYLASASYGMKDDDKELIDSDYERDFNSESFKKTLARDGYVLCCPNCNRDITGTIILRRKEKYQQCQTTCFSCIIALFRCIKW